MPLVLFFVAGGMLVSGAYALNVAQREAALEEARALRAASKEALQEEIEIARLREHATAAGLDPDQVEAGLTALLDGQTTVSEVEDWLKTAVAR